MSGAVLQDYYMMWAGRGWGGLTRDPSSSCKSSKALKNHLNTRLLVQCYSIWTTLELRNIWQSDWILDCPFAVCNENWHLCGLLKFWFKSLIIEQKYQSFLLCHSRWSHLVVCMREQVLVMGCLLLEKFIMWVVRCGRFGSIVIRYIDRVRLNIP